ncbi:MAG: DUF5050 domain-containing protein, partial [Firmicutes bacterium]|nr:DUF5050 domain-containing protein [Bacillota bacterium]
GADVEWDGERQRVIIETAAAEDGAEAYIFYASADDYSKIYRVNADGTERIKISDACAETVVYSGGYLYYTDNYGGIYRCDAGGESCERLLESGAQILGFYEDRLYCADTESGAVYEIGDEVKNIASGTENAELHGGYIYCNRAGEASMIALNLDTYAETAVTMGEIMLAPYNCVFYGKYILVQDDSLYHNIYRFDADGSNKMYINSDNSRICQNQSADENVLFVNNDCGQDIYYVNINGNAYGAGLAADLPDDVVYSDVLAQSGDLVYYKNMYRMEIYRTRLGTDEVLYVGYGDGLSIFGDKLFIDYEGVYISDLDGANLYQIYPRAADDITALGSRIYAVDREYGNIISADFSGASRYITNDRVLSWTVSE